MTQNDVDYLIQEAIRASYDPLKAQQLTQAALNAAKTLEVLNNL